MRRKLALLLIVVVTVACSRGKGDASSPTGTTATPAVESSAAESAVKEYVTSLSDGKIEGMLNYDKAYLHETEVARQSVPSAMWPQKEAQRRAQMVEALTGLQQTRQYNPTGSEPVDRACILVLKSGGKIDFSKLEVRPLPDGRSQAFVQIDYKDQVSAPAVLWQGANRKLKSAMFNLTVEPNGQGTPYVDPRCEPVEGAFAVWDTPPLSKEQAAQLANGVIPQRFTDVLASKVGVLGGNEAEEAAQLKSILTNHGMVIGWQSSPQAIRDIRVKPGDTVKQWVVGNAKGIVLLGDWPDYEVVLLDHADTVVADLQQNGPRASAVLNTTYSGCTPFCEMCKELRQAGLMPRWTGALFMGSGNYDLTSGVTLQKKVEYAFDLKNGWEVAH